MKIQDLNKTPFIQYLLTVTLLIQACKSTENDLIIAEVDDEYIYQSDFVNRYEDYLLQTGIKDNIVSRKEVLNSMITEILLRYYDDNKEILENPVFQKEVKWVENQVVLAFLKDREVYANIIISEEEIREAFLRSNQRIAVRHLFAKTEEEINNIAELIEIGVDFKTLANQVFSDSTLKKNGGYLGYFSWGDMEPEFEEKAFSMKIGEVSKPVKTKHGYSIIKLEDRITHPLLTEYEFQNKKSKFAQILRIRKKLPAEKSFINQIVNFDSIIFNDEQIDKLWESIQLKLIENDETRNILDNRIAVKYENFSYSTEELWGKIDLIPKYHFEKITSRDNLKAVIKGLILQEKLLDMAEDKGYDDVAIVQKKFDDMKMNLFIKFKISEIVENSKIEDSVIFNFYESNPDFFSSYDQINVQEIIVKELSLAKSILEKLNQGEDFGELAEKYSLRESTAINKGIIGLVPIKKFGNFQHIFDNIGLNKIIGPIEIENVYGIFQIIERIESEKVDFEEAREIAEMAVKFKLRNEILNDYVENLKSKVSIQINLKNLGSTKIFQYK